MESYTTPPIPIDEPDGEEAEAPPTKSSSPLEAWLDPQVVLVDCFNDVVQRDKLESADLIGVSGQ